VLNNSNVEINLEGWNLVSEKNVFIFPADTLITNGKKIVFADELTKMTGREIRLLNPLGKEIGLIKQTNVTEKVLEMKVPDLELKNIQSKIEEVKNAVASISKKETNQSNIEIKEEKIVLPTEMGLLQQRLMIDTNMALVFEAKKESGFITRFVNWPIKGLNFVKRLFVEE